MNQVEEIKKKAVEINVELGPYKPPPEHQCCTDKEVVYVKLLLELQVRIMLQPCLCHYSFIAAMPCLTPLTPLQESLL
jgi:hypothetical protein